MFEFDISVLMTTYNHEKYIGQAIESVLMQKFNGTVEILIGEDCSTDNTREVIKQYAGTNNKQIIPLFRGKNMGPINNTCEIMKSTHGKYLAFLEGDDFWTDENKLQKQVEYLQNKPDVIAVYHKTNIVDANGNETDEQPMGFLEKEYTAREFERGIFPGHTSSLVCRNIFMGNMDRYQAILKSHPIIGDRTILMLFLMNGKIKVLPDFMSTYRKILSKTNGNACSIFIQRNMFFEQWKYYDALGKYALSQGSDISMEYLKHLTYVQAFERFVKSRNKTDIEVIKRIRAECKNKKTYNEFLRWCMFEQLRCRITGKKYTSDMIYYEKIDSKCEECKKS